MQKLSIIGYGKMAKAIAVSLNGKFVLEIMGRDATKMQNFVRDNKLEATITPCDKVIDISDKNVIFAIKPYALESFTYKGKARVIYSIMAGISVERLQKCTKANTFVRVMPNIASLVGKGVSVIFVESPKGDSIKNAIVKECKSVFATLGKCIFVDKESYINPAGAISGSGTAYLGLIAEAMIDAGVREGLSVEISKDLTRGLFSGFSALFNTTEAQSIRIDTTSPAGTTIEALAILENRGVRSAFIDAIHAANKKANNI